MVYVKKEPGDDTRTAAAEPEPAPQVEQQQPATRRVIGLRITVRDIYCLAELNRRMFSPEFMFKLSTMVR